MISGVLLNSQNVFVRESCSSNSCHRSYILHLPWLQKEKAVTPREGMKEGHSSAHIFPKLHCNIIGIVILRRNAGDKQDLHVGADVSRVMSVRYCVKKRISVNSSKRYESTITSNALCPWPT